MIDVNPNLCLLQSRLFAPNQSFDGRWTAFDALTRRSFAVVGNKDAVPLAVKILDFVSRNPQISPEGLDGVAKAVGLPNDTGITKLRDANLLVSEPVASRTPPQETFLSYYDCANWNYDYNDYSTLDGFIADRELMLRYKQVEAPPPNFTIREGESHALPLCDFDLPSPQSSSSLDLITLAHVLKMAFGSTALYSGSAIGPWLRKTSPSGGARHPTEGVLILSQPLEGVPPGAWTYDADNHRLVRDTQPYYPIVTALRDRGETLGIILRLRVERPMWRYRELRALRPSTIDVGHVCETVQLLMGALGIRTATELIGRLDRDDMNWLAEPEIVFVRCEYPAKPKTLPPPGDYAPTLERDPANVRKQAGQSGDEGPSSEYLYLTNPFLYIDFHTGMRARTIWPNKSDEQLSFAGFRALSFCFPSQRGDRVTSVSGIRRAIPEITDTEVRSLLQSGALVPIQLAADWYHHTAQWSRKDWYLSLLATLECRAALQKKRAALVQREATKVHALSSNIDRITLRNALLARKTTRRFTGLAARMADVLAILEAATEGMHRCEIDISLFAMMAIVDGMKPGLYRVSDRLRFTPVRSSEECAGFDLGDICVHQAAPGTAAWTAWLVLDLNAVSLEDRQLMLVRLGQIGQLLVLTAVSRGLAVFQSPAARDELLASFLDLSGTTSAVPYVFAFGYA